MMVLVHVVIMTNKEFVEKVSVLTLYENKEARRLIEELVLENLTAKDCCKYMYVGRYSGRGLLYNHCPKCGRKLPKDPV